MSDEKKRDPFAIGGSIPREVFRHGGQHPITPGEALAALLDAMDYTRGACGPTELVSAVVPIVLIENARKALEDSPWQR